ncbi:PREDICTED: 39S ribosomal protein L52, mitochondrial [Trachymyrmex cornetzi]|uniref:Large ribosomal subunit protein mL52 n=1 Tax=Trachymyrmex cornetzi TaxID=471704 RepID=A0A195E6A2_9HYME|nr:PREDICTED: 39S ribosomal protein L52, mitochondrial [Trachymyrmex cornetzi]KYN20730.1 39S ribosomal protein L52, mitochondrial [Trachymyrmex cornetzi]
MISTARAVLHVERHISYNIVVNGFHQSCVQYINQKWRQKRGLTANPNTCGPLTNLPDYTFKNGKPTPLGVRQKARLDKQRDYASKIIKLVGEIDFAVDRHARMQEKEKEERQEILNNKLKPKGDLLLQIQADTIKK